MDMSEMKMRKETKTNAKNNAEFSFRRGYMQLAQRDVPKFREQLMRALRITTPNGWTARVYGRTEPRVSEAKTIEAAFAEYGITDVWGLE